MIELNFKLPLARNLVQLLVFFLCACVSLCSESHAQERCSVEVKLLLSPAQIQTAKSTFDFKNEMAAFVYFFDTDSLDLLAKGVILRLRRGTDSDLTIKLRLPKGKKFFATAGDREDFKCEKDFTGDGAHLSYSIKTKYTAEQLPMTGGDITRLLSQGQKKLLQAAHASIDWSRVKRVVEIKATTWETRAQMGARKLTLEEWGWPDGNLLEISTRTRPDDGPSTYAELRELVNTKGLSLSPIQGFKTSIVLKSVALAKAK